MSSVGVDLTMPAGDAFPPDPILGEFFYRTDHDKPYVYTGAGWSDITATGGGPPAPHAPSHQHGGLDEVAVAAPAANAIPKADGSGTLDAWVTTASDKRVRVTVADTTSGYLQAKLITSTSAVNFVVASPGGDEALEVNIDDATVAVPGLVELATDGESAPNVAVQGNDSRLSDARPPTGAAGGDLNGTYPNPGVDDGADGTAIHDNISGEIAAIPPKGVPIGGDFLLIEDSGDGNSKKRILISALPAGPDEKVKVTSNDTTPGYLKDKLTAQPPAVTWTEVGDPGDEDLRLDIANASTAQPGLVELATDGESAPNVVVQGNDSRLSDARTPTLHGATHTNGVDDVADLVGDSGAGGVHGLVPAPAAGDAAAGKFLKADGVWTVPPSATGHIYYDALVAPAGGDYTSVAAAFAGGATSVFVRDGVYNETADIVVPNGGRLTAESPGRVIINFGGGAFSITSDGNGGTKQTAGTISINHNSSTVNGIGTFFTNLSPGDWIVVDCFYYEIASITNDLQLTLTRTYRGVSLSGFSYQAHSMNVGVHLDGFYVTNSSGPGIYLRGVYAAFLNDIMVVACGYGYRIIDSGGVILNAVHSAHSSADGAEIEDSYNVSMEQCGIYNAAQDGIDVKGSCSVFFDTCSFQQNSDHGVYILMSSDRVTLSDCMVNRNDGKGIETDPSTSQCLMSDCQIIGNGAQGIDFDGPSNKVEGCLIKDNGSHGIGPGDDGIINANIIEDNAGDGIRLIDDPRCVTTGNRCSGNTGYGIYSNADDNVISGNYCGGNGSVGVLIGGSANGNNVQGNLGGFIDNGVGTITTGNG